MYFRDSERESTSRQDSIQEPDEKLGTCEMTVKALRNIIAYCILPPKGRLIIYITAIQIRVYFRVISLIILC